MEPALEEDEQAAYDELNRFLAGLVRRRRASSHPRNTVASRPGTGTMATRSHGRGWSVNVLGVSRLRDVVELCRKLETIPGVRVVRVTEVLADHIHLALVTIPGIDKPAVETVLAGLMTAMPDETSIEIEESHRPGSRSTVHR